jgi:hypothetical protein
MKNITKMSLLASIALFLSACGGGDNWGVDHGQGTPLAQCVNNSQDATVAQATIIPPGSRVNKISQDAVVRVWHFQNSTEAACVVSGEAQLISGAQS